MNYKQIKEEIKKELIVNKSKFISIAYKVNDLDQIDSILNELKINFSDATHICYSYKLICNKQIKEGYFEAKEPKNTSGKQIYNLIQNKELINILIVIIRYYGGVKLGVGLLSRSYLNAAKLVIENSNIIDWIATNQYIIKINLCDFDKLLYLLKKHNIEINHKTFENDFVYLNINLDDTQLKLDFLQKYLN